MWNPVFERMVSGDGEVGYRVGHELINEFGVRGRAGPAEHGEGVRHDLKVFFAVVGKEPA